MRGKGEGEVTDRPPRAFEIAPGALEGAPGVVVRGELDVSSLPRMRAVLEAEIRASEGAFVVDLSDLEFLDSSGLSGLMRARALLGQDDRPLAIICPPGPVRRLFEIAGVTDLFFLYDSRTHAAAALVPRADG